MRVIVSFTEPEMWRIRQLAAGRGKFSRSNGIATQKVSPDSDVEIDLQGMMGEMAVAKWFDQVISLEDGPDPGFDMYLGTYTAQIKATKHADGRLLLRDANDFKADLAILCVIESENSVRLAGWCWRDQFLKQAKEFKAHNVASLAMSQPQLRPMGDLLVGLRANELAVRDHFERAA